MKKLFGVLFIAGALVACNNNSESTTSTDSISTTTVTTDTNTTVMPVDTAKVADTMSNMNKMDTAAKK